MNLLDLESVYKKWLAEPDLGLIRILLACVLCHRWPGDPVWLMIIAPPGSGKTEMIMPLASLPDTYCLSRLTPHTLLSGLNKPGTDLLPRLNNRIILMKDFGTILSLHPDSQREVLAQLREVYDGLYVYETGSGKRDTAWKGRVSFIGAATQAYDHYRLVQAHMGERFLLYRMRQPPADETANQVLFHDSKRMKAELESAVHKYLEQFNNIPAPELTPKEREYIVEWVVYIAQARAHVEWDWGHREIVAVYDAETPSRLAWQFGQLCRALNLIDKDNTLTLLYQLMLSAIPPHRLEALRLLSSGEPITASTIATQAERSYNWGLHVMEELHEIRLVKTASVTSTSYTPRTIYQLVKPLPEPPTV